MGDKKDHFIPLSLVQKRYQRELITLLNSEETIRHVNAMMHEIFPRSSPLVLFWDDAVGAFVPVDKDQADERLTFRIYDDFILWLGDQDAILASADFVRKKKYEKIRPYAEEFLARTSAEIIVPFNLNRSILALLCLREKANAQAYTKKELRFLHEIRNITTIALSNAALYERVQGMLQNMEEKVRERTRDLEEAQAQLVQQEKLAGLGVMVAGIAHEINTPAGVVSGAAENLQKSLNFFLESFSEKKTTTETILKINILANDLDQLQKPPPLNASLRFMKGREIKILFTETYKVLGSDIDLRVNFVLDHSLYDNSIILEKIASLEDSDFLILHRLYSIRQNLRNMRNSLDAILRIVRALKYYSHINNAPTEKADLKEGIESTLVIFHNQLKSGVEIERDYEDNQPITCIVGEMNQIWSNIITNSWQAMKGKGKLKISLRTVRFAQRPDSKQVLRYSELESLLKPDGEFLYQMAGFEDNGPGIPEAIQGKIFDPFFTTKAPGEGTGLGLGIIRNIIQKHNGVLAFKSQPGQTCFYILLPQN